MGIAALVVLATGCTSTPDSPTLSPPHIIATSPVRTSTTSSAASARRSPTATPTTATPTATPAPPRRHQHRGRSLPLGLPTGNAQQVLTAIAPTTSSTQGVLQAWRKVGSRWRRVGPGVPAWFGSDGLSRHASESRSATPIGSFTLTRAFGRLPDPGTALPYTRTTPADWWISQPGPLYNTMQRCSGGCPFTQGDPNEHLYYTVPYYRYAVVIDYNTRNSQTGVVPGAGSAFFLHVTVGAPTQGCISIAQRRLVTVLRWLAPARHPRILIGTR
jgi:L,D-peptidoglycan transpeptidase YkuD (ErfK/YbiS/YcfS/YnhG family)